MYLFHYFYNYLLDLLPLEHRQKSPLTGSQHKPLNQHFLPRTKTKIKKEYNPKIWEKEISSGANEKRENYSTNERTRLKLTRLNKPRGNK